MTSKDRQKILDFILNAKDLSNLADKSVGGGGCASFVSAVIKQATHKNILNENLIFTQVIDLSRINALRLNNLNDLSNNAQIGDILCVLNVNNGSNLIYHICLYVLFIGNAPSIGNFATIGMNGFYRSGATEYKKVIGFNLLGGYWYNNHFIYDKNSLGQHIIVRIQYELEERKNLGSVN